MMCPEDAIERSADPNQGLLLIVVGGEVGPIGSESPVGFLFPFERIPSWDVEQTASWFGSVRWRSSRRPDGGVGVAAGLSSPVLRLGGMVSTRGEADVGPMEFPGPL